MSATVLVVDDSPENRYAARRYLTRAGFEVWEAETGAEGLRRALDNPDLILLDVHLPDIDGFEVCRRLKQDPATARIPILQRSQSHIDDAARVYGLESGADAYLAEPVAPSVLVATARALLRMRRAETRLQELYEQQRHIATTLQAGLLPRRLPAIPGAELATRYNAGAEAVDVGGDFYDVFAREDDWVLVIGDVQGRGAEAAALTSLARHTIRAQAQHHPTPSAILWALNEAVVAESGDESRFLTAGCVIVRGHELTWALGGHPPALILRADGRVDELHPTGSLLGLRETTPTVDAQGHLGAGDALILYTDGVIEARRGRELFGEERLRAVIGSLAGESADRIAGAIQDAAVDFGGSAEDDLAVLVLRQLS
jgi:sigma-B regulation protein RsbU (phosphoserine phosphatase)